MKTLSPAKAKRMGRVTLPAGLSRRVGQNVVFYPVCTHLWAAKGDSVHVSTHHLSGTPGKEVGQSSRRITPPKVANIIGNAALRQDLSSRLANAASQTNSPPLFFLSVQPLHISWTHSPYVQTACRPPHPQQMVDQSALA